jgi:hypothetical protein
MARVGESDIRVPSTQSVELCRALKSDGVSGLGNVVGKTPFHGKHKEKEVAHG